MNKRLRVWRRKSAQARVPVLPRKKKRRQDAGGTRQRRNNIQELLYTKSNRSSRKKWGKVTEKEGLRLEAGDGDGHEADEEDGEG